MAVKTIKLKRLKNGKEHSFAFDHALNLLRLQSSTQSVGWEIADKKWKFEDNEICRKPSTGADKES